MAIWILAVVALTATDASSHTNYLFQILKEQTRSEPGRPLIMKHSGLLSTPPTSKNACNVPGCRPADRPPSRRGAQYNGACPPVNRAKPISAASLAPADTDELHEHSQE